MPDRDISGYLVGQLYVARTLGSNSKLKIAKDSSPHRDNSGVKCFHSENASQ